MQALTKGDSLLRKKMKLLKCFSCSWDPDDTVRIWLVISQSEKHPTASNHLHPRQKLAF